MEDVILFFFNLNAYVFVYYFGSDFGLCNSLVLLQVCHSIVTSKNRFSGLLTLRKKLYLSDKNPVNIRRTI